LAFGKQRERRKAAKKNPQKERHERSVNTVGRRRTIELENSLRSTATEVLSDTGDSKLENAGATCHVVRDCTTSDSDSLPDINKVQLKHDLSVSPFFGYAANEEPFKADRFSLCAFRKTN
jgi:hypothetical protein